MAYKNPELIKMYQDIHTSSGYGQGGHKFVKYINRLVSELKAKTVLDYGCGQSDISKTLKNKNIKCYRYDPAIPAISTIQVKNVDLITCTDVLEHIPPNDIEDFLKHIKSISEYAFFNISTRPATTILEDGRNAHLSVFTPNEWNEKIKNVFPNCCFIIKDYNQSCLVFTWKTTNFTYFKVLENTKNYYKRFYKSLKSRLKRS